MNSFEDHKAETECERHRRRLETQIAEMPIGYIEWDRDFRVLSWNPAAERIFGYGADEALGRHASFIIPSDLHDQVETIWTRLLSGDRTAHSVNDNLTKLGRRITCEWTNTPLQGEEHELLGAFSMVVDITGRIQAEQSLRAAHADLEQRVAERTAALTDSNQRLLHEMVERERAEQQVRQHAHDLEVGVAERAARIVELEAQRAQGEKLAALGQLAAGIAHEINNPVAGIKNAFLLIKPAIAADHPYYEFVGMIEREIDRVASIVQHLYQLYSPKPRQYEEMEIGLVLDDLRLLLDKRLTQRQLTMNTVVEDSSSRLTLPRGDLLQVLLNLIQNAIDCSSPGGVVTLEVKQEHESVRLAVTDQGTGIADHDLPRIFDPFFTTKNTGEHKNIGLGLSLSNNLVQAMGGRIEVRTKVNQGSSFSLIFPRSVIVSDPAIVEHAEPKELIHEH